MDTKNLAEKLLESMAASMGPIGVDEVASTSRMDVLLGDDWLPVEYAVWRSWTGRRMLWGHEFHGPVYLVDSPSDAEPWTGSRACGCKACQQHVQPSMKMN